MTRNITVGYISLCLAIGGCGSKELTRSHAEKLIQGSESFKAGGELKIFEGSFWFDFPFIRLTQESDKELLMKNIMPTMRALINAGIASLRDTGQRHSPNYHEFMIELSPDGKQMQKNWTKTEDKAPTAPFNPNDKCWMGDNGQKQWEPCRTSNGVMYSVIAAERRVREITGISGSESGDATVEFNWEWAPMTKAGKLRDLIPREVLKGDASFKRYDDGWRLTQVNCGTALGWYFK